MGAGMGKGEIAEGIRRYRSALPFRYKEIVVVGVWRVVGVTVGSGVGWGSVGGVRGIEEARGV